MGACFSSKVDHPAIDRKKIEQQQSFNRRMNKQMAKKQEEDSNIKKLLLLGAGESGKSTLFKQLVTLYGKGYGAADRKALTNVIYGNVILSIKTLVKQAQKRELTIPQESVDIIEGLRAEEEIDTEIAERIQALWKNEQIQKAYADRSKFQLIDSAKYFLDRILEIGKSDYVPTEEDMLRVRVRTSGIVETSFTVDKTSFRMVDVGGQRNERKKWIHCFDSVTSVIFVAAISEYDQALFEDDTTNRVKEALSLFSETCNSEHFIDTSFILFLNKKDLFEEKIKSIPIVDYFPSYKGPNDAESGFRFFQALFESCNKNPEKEIYTHVTCATNRDNVKHVFAAVKDILIRKTLRDGGFL